MTPLSPVKPCAPVAPWLGGKRNLARRICGILDAIPCTTYRYLYRHGCPPTRPNVLKGRRSWLVESLRPGRAKALLSDVASGCRSLFGPRNRTC